MLAEVCWRSDFWISVHVPKSIFPLPHGQVNFAFFMGGAPNIALFRCNSPGRGYIFFLWEKNWQKSCAVCCHFEEVFRGIGSVVVFNKLSLSVSRKLACFGHFPFLLYYTVYTAEYLLLLFWACQLLCALEVPQIFYYFLRKLAFKLAYPCNSLRCTSQAFLLLKKVVW